MPHSPSSATQNLCIQGEINLVNECHILGIVRSTVEEVSFSNPAVMLVYSNPLKLYTYS